MNAYKKILAGRMLLLAGMSAMALPSFGWGQKGHDTTAEIAERHLTEATAKAVGELLDGKSIVYWANWLDNASHTPEYAYTKTWHYKNIDEGIAFDDAPLLDTGDVVRAIPEQVKVLEDHRATREQKQLALKVLVHLLGDIHQPMHLGHASDRGANQVSVKFFDRNTNLHSVWDSSVPESGHKWSYTEWADQIDRATPEETAMILQGGPADWGKETFDICTEVYRKTPDGTKISYDYIAEWTPTVERQFLKGGLRLADLLNTIFDGDYRSARGAAAE